MAVAAPNSAKSQRYPKEDVPGITRPMTYEEYLSGPEEMARYDIIDGWKVYRLYGVKQLPNPTREHQDIQGNLYVAFRIFAQSSLRGKAIQAPCDVRITKRPWRSRQPDLLIISSERLAQNPPPNDPAPLSPAPELVVEIISPSDKPSVLAAKIADYRAVDVREVWVVRAEEKTVQVLRLSVEEIETAAAYKTGQTVTSSAFPHLEVAVDDIFAL